MKTNNKKQTRKLLPSLASISFFAVGAMAIMPMATACSNTPPEPSYAEDPTDPNATEMIGGVNFVSKTGQFYSINLPLPSKKIFFRYNSSSAVPVGGFDGENKPFRDAEYVEIGENFGSQNDRPRNARFQISTKIFTNMNIKKLVLRHMGGDAENEKIGYQIFNDGDLDGIKEIFFDFPPDELVINDTTKASKFFTTDPDAIYIRAGNGTVEEWKNKLVGLSTDKIIKVVAPKSSI